MPLYFYYLSCYSWDRESYFTELRNPIFSIVKNWHNFGLKNVIIPEPYHLEAWLRCHINRITQIYHIVPLLNWSNKLSNFIKVPSAFELTYLGGILALLRFLTTTRFLTCFYMTKWRKCFIFLCEMNCHSHVHTWNNLFPSFGIHVKT